MTTSPTVYLVEADANHYASLRDPRLFVYRDIYEEILRGRSLRESWNPPREVALIAGRPGDFVGGPNLVAGLSMTTPVRNFFHSYWSEYVECLPYRYERTDYWAIYLPKVYPCLDEEATEFWGTDRRSIRTAVFREQHLPHDLIFRATGRLEYYCGDAFKQLVQQQKFTGLLFRRLWADGAPLRESVTVPSAPVANEKRSGSVGRSTKRDRILRRLWTDVINSSAGDEWLEVLTDPNLVDAAPYDLLSDAAKILAVARTRGLADDEIRRLLRSAAYFMVLNTLTVLDEEGLASSAALRSLHEDLLSNGQL